MNGGSLDKLVPTGVGILDERILAWVTSCTVRGLKYLKDNLNIIHRGIPLKTRANKTYNPFLVFSSFDTNVLQTSNQQTSSSTPRVTSNFVISVCPEI